VVLHFLLFELSSSALICTFSQRTRRATIGLLLSTIQPDSSSMMAVTILMLNTAFVSIFLKGPDQSTGAYILAVPWE
jgi:hypothetical protein